MTAPLKIQIRILMLLLCGSYFLQLRAQPIMGGEIIDISQVPWQVSLEDPIHNPVHNCGGVILNSEWVLTAAHCIEDNWTYKVYAGFNQISAASSTAQIVDVDATFVRSDATPFIHYSPGTNDLALLHVSPPFCFNENVQPISYATPENLDEEDILPGTSVFTSGWGALNSSSPCCSDDLRGATLEIISNDDANDLISGSMSCEWISDPVDESMIACIAEGMAVGKGDSGGPAVITLSNGGHLLVGVTSWTPGDCTGDNLLSIFANVRDLSDFIDANIAPGTIDCGCPDATTHIYVNTTLNADQDMPGDIVIHSGAELLVEAEIRMRQDRHIFVERNARLHVAENGVLTRGCSATSWGGIAVLGNNALPQPEHDAALSDPDQAGIVWLDNCRVEWAVTGVTAARGETHNSSYLGGLIWAQDAVFRNNQRDVEFAPYTVTLNKSRFYNCDFEEVDNSITNSEGVTIRETNGIVFDQCRFTDKDLEGIRTFDASVMVTNQCEFEGNEYGISSFATYPMSGNIEVVAGDLGENEFRDNTYHINASLANGIWGGYSDGLFGLRVINNDFEGGNYDVVIDGPSNFLVAGNLFEDAPISNWAANTGFNNLFNSNSIRCNRYRGGGNIGIATIGNNREMQFLGNAFEMASSGRDFLLINSWFFAQNGSIRANQGSIGDPADNCFTDPSSQVDILTWGNTDVFDYFVNTSPAIDCSAEPLALGNFNKKPTVKVSINSCPDYGGLPLGPESPSAEDLDTIRSYLATVFPYIQSDTNAKSAYYEALLEKDAIMRQLVRNEVRAHQYSTAEGFLFAEGTKASKQAAYGLMVRRDAYTDARSYLDSLPMDDANDAWFKGIQRINLDRLEQGDTFALSTPQENYLDTIANSTSPIRGYARALLSLLKGERYVPDEIIETRERKSQPQPPMLASSRGLEAKPTPASDIVLLSWPALGNTAASNIFIYNMLGHPISNLQLEQGENSRQINTAAWPSGIYFANLVSQNKIHYSTLLVIQH